MRNAFASSFARSTNAFVREMHLDPRTASREISGMPKGEKQVVCTNTDCSSLGKPQIVNTAIMKCNCGAPFPRKGAAKASSAPAETRP